MAANPISSILRINPRFLRSTQLERDFSDPDALGGYVLTQEVRSNLERLVKGTRTQSGSRCWRVTGDFGSGKSSFALLLANLLSPSNGDLPKQLRGLPNELQLPRSRKGFLPVLVTGSREQMSKAMLSALSQAIYENLDGKQKQNLKVRSAINDAIFELDSNLDQRAVALMQETASELRKRGLYDGVLVIVDELGKFLEYAAMHPERQDVYFLQQLAEASTRSGENCLFTVGLLHQGFSSYADKLSEQGQREWQKVSSRFEEIVFSQPLSQVATLLQAALNVRVEGCPRGWKSIVQEDMRRAIDLGMFGGGSSKTSLVESAPCLYPLHPTVLPVLTKFFRRFGQNERSLFSFLLSSEPHALQDFAQREATLQAVYRLPEFYDFVALNFGNRLSAQSFRSHWNHIDAVIRSYPEELDPVRQVELRVLKTVGLLNTIDSSSDLLASEELIALALGAPTQLPTALANLKKQNLIFYRGASRGYALWSHTSVNLEQAFATATESLSQSGSIGAIIRERLDSRPIVARAHYIKTGNLRHFTVQFCSVDELEGHAERLRPEHPADGLITIVLSETAEQRHRALNFIGGVESNPQLLFGVTDPLEVLSGLVLTLERWYHVERHTPQLKDDRYAAEEVSRQIAHATQTLENALQRYVGIRGLMNAGDSGIRWLQASKKATDLKTGISLQSFLSKACDELFQKAPQIRNELVNRNSISSAAAAARQRLFDLMLKAADQPMLGLPLDKAPPEKSLYLSVLKASGIHAEGKHGWAIGFPEHDPLRVGPALNHIVSILERQHEARIKVSDIFDELRRPPFGVRDGLLPILLLTVYVELAAEIAVYEDGRFVSEIEEFLKMRLVKAPETFEFQLCRINGMRRELLRHLAAVMKFANVEKGELLSIVRPLCLIVAELPEYARNTDRLQATTLAFRAAIVAAKEPADLIFRAIPEALGMKPANDSEKLDVNKLGFIVSAALTELGHAFPECRKRMTEAILAAFGEEGLSFTDWRRACSERAEMVIVGVTNPELRSFALKLIDDASPEDVWLESLGSLVTRCPPSRWKDKDELAFGEDIKALAKQFLSVESLHFGKESQAPENAVRISLVRRTGEERDQVIHLTAVQAKEAQNLRKSLQQLMPTDKKLAASTLSQLLWDLLD